MRTDERPARPLSGHIPSRRIPSRHTFTAGVPVALAGSLAILLTAAPAHAADPAAHPMPGTLTWLDGSRGAAPASVRVPTTAPESYTVRAGDTITAIASRHGLRTVDVLALNGLDWSSVIYPGQVLVLGSAPAAAAPAPAPTAPVVAAAGSYVVQGGDTITSIAEAHGVSIHDVFAANGFDWSSIIYPGQSIAIPGAASAPSAPPAEAAAPTPPPVAPVASVAGAYVVVAGDTISGIAKSHGLSTQAVLDANGLTGASIIYPGQSIAIPGTAPVAAAIEPVVLASAVALDAEQIGNAQTIIAIGRELGVPDRGIAIALGTAMQESWLLNLDWGDRDSLGLFQQRPSAGWGTDTEVSDAVRATRAFYGGASDPNGSLTRGLLDVSGWESLSFADAAQSVQISAYPERYAQWEQPAYAWLAAHG